MIDPTDDRTALLEALDEVTAAAGTIASGIAEHQWGATTPCAEWNVRDLANHMAGSARFLAAAAARTSPPAAPDADHLGVDPAGSLRAALAEPVAAWRRDGALEGSISQPFEAPAVVGLGITVLDLGVHCWDLATATGQEHGLSEGTVALIDGWNRRVITDEARAAGAFAAPLPSDDTGLGAMLAFTGRRA